MNSTEAGNEKSGRPITGLKVLLAFVAFFAVVGAVNGVMIRFATATFRGVEEQSPYQAGLAFNREIAAAEHQDALGWKVQAHFSDLATDQMQLTVNIRDNHGQPPGDIQLEARLSHPSDQHRDRDVAMLAGKPGTFAGTFGRDPGQWNLVIEAWRGDERLFRSVNRVSLH